MKKAVTSLPCGVMACSSMFVMLLPLTVAAAGTADRRFLRATAVKASRLHVDAPPFWESLKKVKLMEFGQVPMVGAAPAPMPAMGPAPGPGPAGPPPPPCNWTYDGEGVARPVICSNMSDGNFTCDRGANLTFDTELIECTPPTLLSCDNPAGFGLIQFPLDEESRLFSIIGIGIEQETIPHGTNFDIVCSDNATAVDRRYPLESFGQEWYPGVTKTQAVCNNGTVLRMMSHNATCLPGFPCYKPESVTPNELRCVLKEKVSLTQDDISYLRWSEPRVAEAEKKAYKWIDVDAIFHKKTLKDAMNESVYIEKAARDRAEFEEIPVLKKVIKTLIDQRMIPRGEVVNDAVCKDMGKHWLYGLENGDTFKAAGNIGFANYVPAPNVTMGYPAAGQIPLAPAVGLSCSYTMQKTFAGYDAWTREMTYHYRDGCYCESRWTGGCPFRAELQPNFQTFGFDSIETKHVSSEVGAGTNALCWYFTKPQNPEWGYLRSDLGYTYQAPLKNVTQLKTDWIDMKKLAQEARFNKKP